MCRCVSGEWIGGGSTSLSPPALLAPYLPLPPPLPPLPYLTLPLRSPPCHLPLPPLLRYSLDGLSLVEAVAHEGCRIFRDRLVGEHIEQFNSILKGVLSSHLGYR